MHIKITIQKIIDRKYLRYDNTWKFIINFNYNIEIKS